MNKTKTRREFLLNLGRGLGAATLAGVALRVLSGGSPDAEFIQPPHRYGWQINPDLCKFCGLCETACVRTPSAVKAVNDQKKCSDCVACYGHLKDLHTPSEKIATCGKRVCPRDAVVRTPYYGGLNGAYLYTIDHNRCTGCAQCAHECNRRGSKSMFMVIRADICFNCNECSIARVCPHKAVERVPLYPVDDFRGEYMPNATA